MIWTNDVLILMAIVCRVPMRLAAPEIIYAWLLVMGYCRPLTQLPDSVLLTWSLFLDWKRL